MIDDNDKGKGDGVASASGNGDAGESANDRSDRSSADWREAIWSVPRHFVFAYFALVTGIGWPTLTYILWQTAPSINEVWWRWPFELVIAAAPRMLTTGGGIAIYALFTVQGAAFLMVLYEFAVNRWVKPVIKRHKDEGRVEGRKEGIAIGREEGISTGREEGIAIGREEGIGIGREEGVATGIERGRKEAYQELQAWRRRKEAAESQGLPFDEPEPGTQQ